MEKQKGVGNDFSHGSFSWCVYQILKILDSVDVSLVVQERSDIYL